MRVNQAQAIALLKAGDVVAIPTETVYGLAADARNASAIAKIFATKQRPAHNPLIVHIADIAAVSDWASEFPPLARALAERFWPGPLTLVLPARQDVLMALRADAPTVALRVPAHPLALAILKESGLGFAAPSANLYTQLSPTTATHVEASLGAEIPVLDGGPCAVGIESTIVSVQGDAWQLLRPGMIDLAQLTHITGKPPVVLPAAETPKAPGQHLLHYSPRTPCQLMHSREAVLEAIHSCTENVCLLFGDPIPDTSRSICLPRQASLAAEQLYAALHALDQLGAKRILIEYPPIGCAWEGVRDRLCRAAYQTAND